MTDTYQPSETYNPLRIKIGGPPVAEGDPWAGALTDRPEAAQSGSTTDAWAGALTERPTTKAAETKARETEISAPAAAAMGVAEGASFGAAPAIVGTHAAGMSLLPQEAKDAVEKYGHSAVLGPLLAGLGRLGYEDIIAPALGIQTGTAGTEAYQKAREAYGAEQQAASEQHPVAYTAGQVGGALATPSFGVGAGTTTAARIGSGITSGAIGGGLYGIGQAIGEGKNPGIEAALSLTNPGAAQLISKIRSGQFGIPGSDAISSPAATGAVAGAAFGGAGAGLLTAAQKGASKVASIFRGARDPKAEAKRTLLLNLMADFKANGQKWTPETLKAAQDANIPLAWVDRGGEATRALARSAANRSPEGRQALTDVFDPRFKGQSERAYGFIRNLMPGGRHTIDEMEAIEAAARARNAPAYKRAYAIGDRPIWSPELERLSGAKEVRQAAHGAEERWNTFQILDGFGAANPGMKVTPDGQLKFSKGGIPTYPNMQFWDYTARNLAHMAAAAREAGSKTEAGMLGRLEKLLKDELDKQVPSYAVAREGAHSAFKADNALEAGIKYLHSRAIGKEALMERRAIAKMGPAERDLFARGFMHELADSMKAINFNSDILNSIFINNAPALEKIKQVLGPARAKQLEAYLRAEELVNTSRKAMGGSTTARQTIESSMAKGGGAGLVGGGVGGAVAAYDAATGADFDPKTILYSALFSGGLRYGAQRIDAKVAQHIAEMLASNDPAVVSNATKIISSRPYLMDALRRATGAGTRVAAHDIGPTRAIAGAGAVLGSVLTPPEAKSVNPYSNSQFVNQ